MIVNCIFMTLGTGRVQDIGGGVGMPKGHYSQFGLFAGVHCLVVKGCLWRIKWI
jgi:hypothetical protein